MASTRRATLADTPPVASGWRNRIEGYGEEAPGDLLANPRNWRLHPKSQQDALGEVLAEVRWVTDVIVNKRTGFVLDGHLRVELAISKGEATVPVKYVDLSEDEEALVLLTFDPIAGMAERAEAQLASLMADVGQRDGALGDLFAGMGSIGGEPVADPGAEMDRVEELREKWGVERGQVWMVGEHRAMCGDSTDAGDVARLMAGAKAEVLWTDPPYGVSYVGKTDDALGLANDDALGLPALLADSFAVVDSVLSSGARIYCACPPGKHNLTFRLAFRDAGWNFHEGLVWVKDSMVLGHSDYHIRHEDILYGWKPGEGRVGRGNHAGTRWYGGHAQTTVFEIERPKASEEHPTMKPPELIAAHLQNSSKRGDIILDPFLGSGTTLVACEQLNRRGYGMEIEPKYVAVSLERLAGMGLTPKLEA